ncbi:MAG: chemotaxis protein CheD [Pseudomonadota bacterium]
MHITQGEHAVSADRDAVITTLLGSCVACCLWDPEARIGGMNHMLLSARGSADATCNLAGVNAMELLINDLIKLGARRDNLHGKAFGGARMIKGLSDIGAANASFALDFLEREGIACEGHSLGGEKARMLKFWPSSGRVLQKIANGAQITSEQPIERVGGNAPELF